MPEKQSFEAFTQAVKESVETHAKRKNYIPEANIAGANPMLDFKRTMGWSTGHHMGEILGKMAEYTVNPKRVMLEKICGWAYLEWRNAKD